MRDDNVILIMEGMMFGCWSVKEGKWAELIVYNRREEERGGEVDE